MKSGQTYEIIMLFILEIFIYLNMSNTIYKSIKLILLIVFYIIINVIKLIV